MQLTLEFTILLGHQNILTRPTEHYSYVHKPKVDLWKSTKPSDTSKLASKRKSMKKIPLPTNFFTLKKVGNRTFPKPPRVTLQIQETLYQVGFNFIHI